MKTVYLETFGCQMNELDSELVRGHLESLGYRFTTETPMTPSVLLFNTCSVREQAESKAYSRVGIVGKRKKAGEKLILGRPGMHGGTRRRRHAAPVSADRSALRPRRTRQASRC